MTTGLAFCSVCTTREAQSFCICKFPLLALCEAADCREVHTSKRYASYHYFLSPAAANYVTDRNHRSVQKRVFSLNLTHEKLTESLSLLDAVLERIEETYRREVATLTALRDEYISKVNQLKETADAAFSSATKEIEQYAVDSGYNPRGDIARWVCTEATKAEDDDVQLFSSEIRETQKEDKGVLFAVEVKSLFKSLQASNLEFPVDCRKVQKEQIERLQMTVAELERKAEESERTITSLTEQLKSHQNCSGSRPAGGQKKFYFCSRIAVDGQQLYSPSSGKLRAGAIIQEGKHSPHGIRDSEERKSVTPKVNTQPLTSPRPVSASLQGTECAGSGIRARVDLHTAPHRKRALSEVRKDLPASGIRLQRKRSVGTVPRQSSLLPSSPTATANAFPEDPEINLKRPRDRYGKPLEIDLQAVFPSQPEESTDSLCRWQSESQNTDVWEGTGVGLSDTKASTDTQTTEKQVEVKCRSCGSVVNPEDASFQCPSSCLCKLCSIDHVLARKWLSCTHCGKNFSEEVVTAIQGCAKQCHLCGIALPLSEFPANASCDVCLLCVEVTAKCVKCGMGSFGITGEEMGIIQRKRSESACGCEASESLFHSLLLCGHRVCKVHASSLLVCRFCKNPNR